MDDLRGIRIGFFGTPDFALESLKVLKDSLAQIDFVATQSPKPSGRGQKVNFSVVHKWSKKNNINVIIPQNMQERDFFSRIEQKKLDFIIVVAYGSLLSEKILNLPKYMSLNVHASLLPRWRGAAPIQRSIINGDQITGVSIMKVDKELDAGPVILKRKVRILSNDNSGKIHDKLSNLGAHLLINAIKKICSGKYSCENQDSSKVTYAKKIKKIETKINWENSADYNHKIIRAFNPWPGAWTYMNQKKRFRIKILESEIVEMSSSDFKNAKPGFCSDSLLVKCNDKLIQIKKIQKEGKKPMTSSEFINGYKPESCLLD
tara:strand:- start:374 stop:1327 length:954 start_codon:yes stop_codon:yes gene_type:complete